MKFQLSVIMCCFLAVGCVEVKDQNEKKSKATEVSQIAYEIEPLDRPQGYLVRFSGLNCSLNFRRTSKLKSRISANLRNCEDIVDESGLHEYEWIEGTVAKSLSVNIPEDKIIVGTVQLDQLNPADFRDQSEVKKQVKISGRLYLRAGSRLVTNGESVLIEAELIHSEGASILTFESGSRAPEANLGRSGGLVYLKSEQIKGVLNFELRGQHGGNGETTAVSRKRWKDLNLNGANGGNSGKLWIESENLNHSQVNILKEVGQPGIGTDVTTFARFEARAPRVRTILRPKGPDGSTGFEEKSCLIVNQKCEALNLN